MNTCIYILKIKIPLKRFRRFMLHSFIGWTLWIHQRSQLLGNEIHVELFSAVPLHHWLWSLHAWNTRDGTKSFQGHDNDQSAYRLLSIMFS